MRILHWLLQTDRGVVGLILRITHAAVIFPDGAPKVLGWLAGRLNLKTAVDGRWREQ